MKFDTNEAAVAYLTKNDWFRDTQTRWFQVRELAGRRSVRYADVRERGGSFYVTFSGL